MKKYYLYILVFTFLLGCDNIEGDYIEENAPFLNDVYLFEFTGVHCPNCPEAHRVVSNLQDKFGEKLHVISIHAGGFALPRTSSDPDFRTEVGDAIHEKINIKKEYPSGSVMSLSDGNAISPTAWASELGKNGWSRVNATIKYATTINDNVLNANVKVELKDLNEGEYSLCLYVVENDIVAMQIDGGSIIEDYSHKHVLRATMNGVWGTELNTGSVFENEFSVGIKNEWDINNIHLIPFVYNKTNNEILVANITKTE